MAPSPPAYDLEKIKALVREGSYRITKSAAQGARDLYLEESDILECVLELHPGHFYKLMEAEKRPGFFQDVYRRRFHGFQIYLKVQISARSDAVIISFKRDESA